MTRLLTALMGLLFLTLACSNDDQSGNSKAKAIECQQVGDCAGTEPICDPLSSECVECLFDQQCPDGGRCEDRHCVARAQCSQASDCAAPTPICDVRRGVCEECVRNTDCGEDSECRNYKCLPYTPCTNSLDCSTEEVCDEATDRCVDCLKDTDCEETEWCNATRCETRTDCDSDKDCTPSGRLCHPERLLCVQCLDHDDCPAEYFCSGRQECEVDICIQGGGECPASNVAHICNPTGNAYDEWTCESGQSCEVKNSLVSCSNWVCTAGATYCDANVAIDCSDDGLTADSSEDCGEDKVCDQGKCLDKICEPGKYFCRDGDVHACHLDSATSSEIDVCLESEYCRDGAYSCRQDTCTPGAAICDGTNATLCADDGGVAESGATDCAAEGAICVDGACAPVICTPSTYSCSDANHIVWCSADGTSLSPYTECGFGRHCVEGNWLCAQDLCLRGAAACNGDVATRCNADGDAYEPGGTDCRAQDATCVNGACVPWVCTPNAFSCSDGAHVVRCSSDGASTTAYRTCSFNQHCVDGQSSCATDKCVRGQASCNGDIAAVCKADGTGFEPGQDCSVAGDACYNGVCLPKICEAGKKFCQDGNSQNCLNGGTSSSLYDTCRTTEYCSAETGYCSSDRCTPSAPVCNGDVATTCASDGGNYVDGGTDCTLTGKVCDAGACKTKICEPNTYSCDGNVVNRCSSTGASKSLYRTCSDTYYCLEGSSSCQLDVCANGAAVCDGERATTCEADGSGYVAGGTDCAASSKYCSAGTCSSCDPRAGLRLAEFSPNEPDYVVIKNTSATCAGDLRNVHLQYRTSSTGSIYTFELSSTSVAIAAGAQMYVTERTVLASDVYRGWSFYTGGSYAGYVMLCDGPCAADGKNVLDAIAYGGTSLPAGVTFLPGNLSATLSTNDSFLRAAYTGTQASGFQRSDWTTGTGSR